MSDDLNPGDGPDHAANPAVAPSGVAALPQEAKEEALRLMAQADDAADFVAEKRDQEAEHRGEPEAPPKRTSRHERYKRAIERLRHENMQLRGGDAVLADGAANNAAAPDRPEPAPPQQHGESLEEHERRIRREAAFELRAKEYFRENPTARQEIGATLSLYEPADHVAEVILRSEIGPALAHELSKYPDAVLDLNESPPAEVARVLGIVEGRLRAQRAFAERQHQAPPHRRMTGAPAPLSTVRGGAAPTPDLRELAKRDDVSAYAAERRRQQAEGRRR
jgi:hypothetical protein